MLSTEEGIEMTDNALKNTIQTGDIEEDYLLKVMKWLRYGLYDGIKLQGTGVNELTEFFIW